TLQLVSEDQKWIFISTEHQHHLPQHSELSPFSDHGWPEPTVPGHRQQLGASSSKLSRREDVPRNIITMKIKSPVTEGNKKISAAAGIAWRKE
ncbi:hypothetical protein Nmel_018733, partial [Mimus melanotis]